MAVPTAPDTAPEPPRPLPRPVLCLTTLLAVWVASTACTVVVVAALLDPDWQRGSALTAGLSAAAALVLAAFTAVARDVIVAVRACRWGDEAYWAGYTDCARALLGGIPPGGPPVWEAEPPGAGPQVPRQGSQS